MQKIRKLTILCLSILSLGCIAVACESNNGALSSTSNPASQDSVHEESSIPKDSQDGSDSSGGEQTPPEDDFPATYYWAETVMNEAALLSVGESLSGTYELSGTLSSKSDYKPTDYVEVSYTALPATVSIEPLSCEWVYYYNEKKFLGALPYSNYLVA